jgi:hypothetical protein
LTAYIFLGPSLPLDQAKSILDATYLPPVQQGDLLRLLELKPRYIGIIDGYFETVPAVWHKEILLALSQGVHVFGAASMGALRAAELSSFGMVGVGKIFEWFKNETISADDEVAVRHGPPDLNYLPLNQALVDLRDGCALAVEEGLIGSKLADQIISVAKALPFWDRTCETISAGIRQLQAVEHHEIDAWQDFMRSRYVSLKARDAAALLVKVKECLGGAWQPKKVDFGFEQTIFIERLLVEIAVGNVRKSADFQQQPADQEAQLMDRLRRAALLRVVAREQAKRSGWELNPVEVSERVSAFWSQMGIASAGAAQHWMKQNNISDQTLQSYLADQLYIARLNSLYRVEVERELALQLLLSDESRTGRPA